MCLAYRPEPEPVVAEHYSDGVVQQPAVQQLGQRVGRPLVHSRRCVHVVVTERVQPEHGKIPVAPVQPDEVLHVTVYPVRRGPRTKAEIHAVILDYRQVTLGRQHVRPRVIVGRRVPKSVFSEVVSAHAGFVFHVSRNVTCSDMRARRLSIKCHNIFTQYIILNQNS